MQVGVQWFQERDARGNPIGELKRMPINASSAYAIEMAKHEAHFSEFGPPGRPYEYRAYPTAMYKASRTPQGGEPRFEYAQAGDDAERERLERVGFVHGGKAAAVKALERQEFEIAELAANRAFTDRTMSEKARAEAAQVDESTVRHLATIPETPVKRRGRKPKSAEPVSA